MRVLITGVRARVRGKRLHRLIQIISLLKGPTAWNARKLAAQFNTSVRNIRRDLAILELAGCPFYHDPEHGEYGGYRIRSEFFFPAISLTDQECVDLAVLSKAAEGQRIPLVNHACQVRDKILATLPKDKRDLICHATELFDVMSLRMADHEHCRHIMRTLQTAMLQRKQVAGEYRSPHRKKQDKVQLQPRRVFLCNQAWYLAGYCNKSHETRLYRLARFKELRLVNKPITVSPQFSLAGMLGNAWGVFKGERDFDVEIVFNPEAAELVAETRWHDTQQLIPHKDGSMTFKVRVSGLEEIVWWVLTWGPRAKVIKPRELQQSVRKLMQETAQLYENGSEPTSKRKPT